MDKVNEDYKKAFSLGYGVAKELGLKKPMFKNQNEKQEANNPIQAGMLQYINENNQTLVKTLETSNSVKRVKDKNKGFGLST